MESLCWTCARCRDKPDPVGCVKTRTFWGEVPEGIEIDVSKRTVYDRGIAMELVSKKVTNCPQYVRSSGKTAAPKQLTERQQTIKKWNKFYADKRRDERTKQRTAKPRHCEHCGRLMPIEKTMGAKYCSYECGLDKFQADQRAKRAAKRVIMDKINCVICGTEFVPHNHRVVCCSKSCSAENQKRLVKARKNKYQVQSYTNLAEPEGVKIYG